MTNYLEDIIKFIESIVVLFTIPYAYVESYNNKYEKIISTIEEIGTIVLFRIGNKFIISESEINSLIKSELAKEKINQNAIAINDILDYLIHQIETNPFVTRLERRKLLELFVKLKSNKTLNKIEYYRWISSNKKSIYTITLITISLIALFFPQRWSVFETLKELSDITTQLIIGICIAVVLFFVFRIFRYVFKGTNIDLGEPKLNIESFSYLPNYFNEKIEFKSSGKSEFFNLVTAQLSPIKKLVETDYSFFSFGIAKMYKTLNSYNLKFISGSEIHLEIAITKKSFVNGIYDLDYLVYKIKNNLVVKEFSLPIDNENELSQKINYTTTSNFREFNNKYNLDHGFLGDSSNDLNVILNAEKKLYALAINDDILYLK